jgi:uncharacterized protein YbjQ (UPF0145 family)
MIIFRKYPDEYKQIQFIDFISSESLIKLNDQVSLHYMFDLQQTSREAKIAKEEFEGIKKAVIRTLEDKSNSLGANAIIEFQFNIQKLDNKHILIQAQGFAVIVEMDDSRIVDSDDPNTSLTGRSKDVEMMKQEPTIQKLINDSVMDIGGSHQFNIMSNAMQQGNIDYEPLEVRTSNEVELDIPSRNNSANMTNEPPIINEVVNVLDQVPIISNSEINQVPEIATQSEANESPFYVESEMYVEEKPPILNERPIVTNAPILNTVVNEIEIDIPQIEISKPYADIQHQGVFATHEIEEPKVNNIIIEEEQPVKIEDTKILSEINSILKKK